MKLLHEISIRQLDRVVQSLFFVKMDFGIWL